MTLSRLKPFLFAAALIAALSACQGSGADSSYTLRLNTGVPATHHSVTNVAAPWAKAVEQGTGGRVNVELYNGGTLGPLTSVVSDLQGGVYDAGFIIPTYFQDSGVLPLTISTLAFAYPNVQTGNEILDAFQEKYYDVIQIKGIRIVGANASDLYQLFSTTPINSVDDLQGKKVKVTGQLDALLVKSWGGIPVQIPTGETYQALERGTIDVAPYTVVGAMGTKYYEVAPYVTMLNAWGQGYTAAIREQWLSELPPDLKTKFETNLLPRLHELTDQTYVAELQSAMKKLPALVKDAGGRIIELSPAQRQAFAEPARAQWNSWSQTATSNGFNGSAMVDSWLTIMRRHGAEPPISLSKGTS